MTYSRSPSVIVVKVQKHEQQLFLATLHQKFPSTFAKLDREGAVYAAGFAELAFSMTILFGQLSFGIITKKSFEEIKSH